MQYLTLGLLSSLWHIYHSTTAYFLTHPVYRCTHLISLVAKIRVFKRRIGETLHQARILVAKSPICAKIYLRHTKTARQNPQQVGSLCV